MGHTYCNTLVHVIFSTKGRKPTIDDAFQQRLYEYLSGVARQEFGRALKLGGTQNHLHALLSVQASVSIADAMEKWKSLSSGWVHNTFVGSGDFAWQTGYGAFSVSASKAAEVIGYIENQATHHKTMTFEEEFIKFLERHEIEYDPKYVWD